ncbi:preprotein translocase subunit YajC [Soehngenia longivitae]|uniref:Preprotein translocase subunit YajC n=1 Tax=Soehngenia longivitae TaxID=2562294 RepID=A0A4Z0D2H3_9FIRM|nr:preprotein translocase subunit YajC [Soehngenia longivitae]TFZ39535.1 preprotein translocase subunit YajC [Soehngenia longivitae]
MEALQALILPIAFLAIFYFLAIRPQKKKEKQVKEMRDSLKIGDEIITIGGLYGKVVKVKDDYVTLEVGPSKAKMDFAKWAVGSVVKSRVANDSSSKQAELKDEEDN